jgi:hypothetical protein
MKHIKEYSDDEISSLSSDLSGIGQSEWKGHFITTSISTTSDLTSDGIFVVSENTRDLAEKILNIFGIEDLEDLEDDIEEISSVEDIMDLVNDLLSGDMSDMLQNFSYIYSEMKPKELKSRISTFPLILFGKVLEEGKRLFSDFELKLAKHLPK